MTELQATWTLGALGVYLGCGLIFALPFLLRGAAAIDEDAREGSWGFRILITPGVLALWPLLLHRWRAAGGAREERSPHRDAARRGAAR